MTNPIITIAEAAYGLHQEFDGALVHIEVTGSSGVKIAVTIGLPEDKDEEDDDTDEEDALEASQTVSDVDNA